MVLDYKRCSNCGSSDIDVIMASLYNNDIQGYVRFYGVTCTFCGKSTPVIYDTIEEAFEAWNLDIDILN